MALVKDFSKIAGGSFINLLIGLLTTPVITRMVSPEYYGNWSLFVIYSNVLAYIMLLGTDQVITRYYYKYDEISYRVQLVKWCCLLPLCLILITSVPQVLILHYIRPSWNWLILCLFVLNTLANVFNRLLNILLRFENKINVLSLSIIFHKIIFVVVVVTSLYCIEGYQFKLLSFSSVISTSITTLMCLYFIGYLFYHKAEVVCVLPKREMMSYGIPLMISGCSYLLFQTTDKLVVSHFLTELDLGIYSSAGSLLSLFAIFQSSFTTVWWPTVMKNYNQTPENHSIYIRANDVACFIMLFFGFTFILFKDVIVLLLGQDYRDVVLILPFIIFQPIMYTLSETTVIGLNFKKKSNVQLCVTFAALVFNVVVNIFFTKSHGIIGTSIAVGLSYIFFFALRTLASYNYYKIRFHFLKMFVCVFILFLFALVHSINSNSTVLCLVSFLSYLLVFIMYRNVFFIIKDQLIIKIRNIAW